VSPRKKSQRAPGEDKAMRPGDDKLARDQATLERDFDPPPAAASDHKTVTCYNPACPDYRQPRTDGRSCGCKRTAIGAT
jgi:hypothetical protein